MLLPHAPLSDRDCSIKMHQRPPLLHSVSTLQYPFHTRRCAGLSFAIAASVAGASAAAGGWSGWSEVVPPGSQYLLSDNVFVIQSVQPVSRPGPLWSKTWWYLVFFRSRPGRRLDAAGRQATARSVDPPGHPSPIPAMDQFHRLSEACSRPSYRCYAFYRRQFAQHSFHPHYTSVTDSPRQFCLCEIHTAQQVQIKVPQRQNKLVVCH